MRTSFISTLNFTKTTHFAHTALYNFVCTQLKEDKTNFLLLDEVQEVESFELCLRSLLAESKCDITVTGSNAQMLSGELATTLS